jgi:hypothetical protein
MSSVDELVIDVTEKPRSLVDVILRSGIDLFVDSTGIARLRRPTDGLDDWAWPIDSEFAIAFLSKFAFDHNGTMLKGSELSAIVRILQGCAFENYRPDVAASDLVERDPVLRAVVRFMGDERHWKGPAAKLLVSLRAAIIDEGIDFQRDKSWPKVPAQLSVRLRQLRPALERFGIRHSTSRTARQRSHLLETIARTPSTDDAMAAPSSSIPSSLNAPGQAILRPDDARDDRLTQAVEGKET